jgi:ceramide glucosyltransferase
MAYIIAVVLLGVSFCILGLFTLGTIVYRRGKKVAVSGMTVFPKVSILKPLKNLDDGLDTNLESYYRLDYPDFEIVFGLDSCKDECVPFLEIMRQKHPGIVTRIVYTGTDKLMNPKIDTLAKAAAASAGSLYWVADSNTRVQSDTLKKLVHEYTATGAKIVFSPIRGTGSRTIGSVIENAYLNLFVSGSIIAGWLLNRQTVIVGKSMLIEKAALDRLGGFDRFREYLAEDFMMGEIYREHGLAVSTNFTWITNFNSHTSIAGFLSRISRWSKMRYHIKRGFYLSEILLNPIGLALLALPFAGSRGEGLLAAAAAGKIFLEYVNFFFINEGDRKKAWIIIGYPFIIVLKDLLALAVFPIPLFNSTAKWRGRHIRLGSKSRIIEVKA